MAGRDFFGVCTARGRAPAPRIPATGARRFILSDFTPGQFTLAPSGDVFLIDGPDAHAGPVAAYVRSLFPSRHLAHVLDDAPTCDSAKDCARTKPSHACHARADARWRCEPGSTGAPEAAGHCHHGGHCDVLSAKTHVYDLAAKRWLLPRIVDLADDRAVAAALANVSTRMLRHRPADRPTFADLLDWTADGFPRAGWDPGGSRAEPSSES